jgi:hypothetical protein
VFLPLSYRKRRELSISQRSKNAFQKGVAFRLHRTAENAESAEWLCVASDADFSALSVNAAVKDERGEADLRRDRRHRATVHPPRRRGNGDKPREDKAVAAAQRPDKRLVKGVSVYFDGREELRPGPVKTQG